MSTIKRTGPKPPSPAAAKRRSVASCGPTTPTERAASSCGGWVGRSTRSKTEKSGKTEKGGRAERKSASTAACGPSPRRRNPAEVSSCGGAGWSRWGKIPSGC